MTNVPLEVNVPQQVVNPWFTWTHP